MKKMARKILSVLLAALMLASALPLHAAADDALPFTDVPTSSWYYESVKYAYDNGLMQGTASTEFSPLETLTRAMLVTVLWRMQGSPSAELSGFADVPANSWYSNAVAWAQQNDIVNGYSSTKFGPNDKITREQLTTLFYRYAKFVNANTAVTVDLEGYEDWHNTSSWAREAMQWAVAIGLVQGTGEKQLSPGGNATRAEVAAILTRFCEKAITKNSLRSSKTALLIDGSDDLIFYYEAPGADGEVRLFVEGDEDGLLMYDDGNYASHGDDIAGDGVYSLRYYAYPSDEQKLSFTAKSSLGTSNAVSVGFFKPLTSAELDQLDTVSNEIDALTDSAAFQNMTETGKASAAKALLQSLTADNQIDPSSIIYNPDEHIVCFTYTNGVLGCVQLEEFDSEFNGFRNESRTVVPEELRNTSKSGDSRALGTALILNSFPAFETKQVDIQYRTDFYVELQQEWNNAGLKTTLDTDVTVNDYKQLAAYNVVCISTHGSTYNGQPVICLAEKQSSEKDSQYSIELKSGQIVSGSRYSILPFFFHEQYGQNDLKNTFIFSECCCFLGEGPEMNYAMADALEGRGAKTVIGFHNSVWATYSRGLMRTYINELIDGKTATASFGEAVNVWGENHEIWWNNTQSITLHDWWEDPAQHETPCPPRYGPGKYDPDYHVAFPALRGQETAKLINNGLLNGNVELFHLSGASLVPTYWNIDGDVRSITQLGELTPVGENNNRMAIVTSGVGSMQNAVINDGTEGSRMYQTFVVPEDVSELSFTYNFVSEEPMEYVGSQFNDAFLAQLLCDGELVVDTMYESINSSAWYELNGVDFDGGDYTAYQTGWKTVTINLSAYRGKTVTISFIIYDVGDRIYDSACLLDNILLQ